MPHFSRIGALAALLAAAALTGCAALQPQSPEEIVAQRAQQRWELLKKQDFAKAWDYTQPGFRAVVPQADYAKRFGSQVAWKTTELQKVECQPERCTVTMRLTSLVTLPGFGRDREVGTSVKEEWVRDEGQWWFYQAL
ncbi:MAG: hypothetical protein Q4F13_14620 [Pseudomonadota bacterium]|nr:hypothetical protein [Pseudomonadota bacterium]